MATPRFTGSAAVMSSPSMARVPPLIGSSPAMQRSSVDLPQPDGPTSTTNSPLEMARSALRMISRLP